MAKSQETFNKKEREKKRLKTRQDKKKKMEERKGKTMKGKSLEEMMAYLDENGNLSAAPPDARKMKTFMRENIQIGTPKQEKREVSSGIRNGVVSFFNQDKGFGFINDLETQERIFIHINKLSVRIKESDKVTFEVELGPKGPSAINVDLINA